MQDNKYYGIYQGIVTNVKDTEKRGRIKVKCPDILGNDVESAWCDPCVPVSFDKEHGGDFCLPFNNETVWIMFIGGDVNFPVWLGGWWSEKASPLKDADYDYTKLGDVRVISYRDFKITIHQDECIIENNTSHTNKGAKNKIIMDGEGIHISTDKVININAKGNVNIKGANINLN